MDPTYGFGHPREGGGSSVVEHENLMQELSGEIAGLRSSGCEIVAVDSLTDLVNDRRIEGGKNPVSEDDVYMAAARLEPDEKPEIVARRLP